MKNNNESYRIEVSPDKSENIVKILFLLHNIILDKEGIPTATSTRTSNYCN